ncbi:hypothetical protein GBA52_011548 [Prunus armeniaca]|nr:hypothetical protein GBA52_011548 [Prunus armeniaca]
METMAKDGAAQEATVTPNKDVSEDNPKGYTVIYVLGGPGSGKSTLCAKIAPYFGFCHLSVGDLLEAEVETGSEYGEMIEDCKKEGRLVPSDLVVKLLQQAMQRSQNKKFVIDGFPRNEENRAAAESIVGLQFSPDFVLFLDCSEEEMKRRLLNRNQGRVDDNINTIQKRLKVYFECTLPVINYYSAKGKVRKIDAERSPEEVFEAIKDIFFELKEKHGRPSDARSLSG